MTKTATIGHNQPPPISELMKEKYPDIFDRARKWLNRAKRADLEPKTLEDCGRLELLVKEARDIANDANTVREKEKEEPLRVCKEIDAVFNGEIRDALGTDAKKPGLAQTLLQAAARRRGAIAEAQQREAAERARRAAEEAERLRQKAESQEARGQVRQADVTEAQAEATERHAADLAAQAEADLSQASKARVGSASVSVSKKLKCTGVVRGELDLEALRPYFDQDALVKAVNNALKMKAFTELKGAAIVEDYVGRVR